MEVFIPITLFLVFGMSSVAYLFWNHRNRLAMLDTVQKAIQNGAELTPDLLDRIGSVTDPRIRDLRRGVVLFFTGVAGLLASMFLPDANVIAGIRAFAMLPLMMGVGFLLVWKITPAQR